MQTRRDFIRKVAMGGGLLAANAFPFDALAQQDITITILHTNDTHSRLDPFPADDRNFPGQGGIVARATAIEQIRKEQHHVLLLDAGDIFQGTPYFNEYKGEPEIKAMSMMGYDASTMGNHDFDIGLEEFMAQMGKANFPFLVANYNFNKTILEGKIKPYKVFKKGPVKIGVFGLGIQLHGLVPQENYGKIWYNDPIKTALEITEKLKKKEGCDMVICLSHLGYSYEGKKVSDRVIAAETQDIDLIIGGHTHTFLNEPQKVKNKLGKEVLINQVGWAGLRLGRIDFVFDHKKAIKNTKANTVILGK
ncbi:metallophosphatase [Taibaiella sp. KBW10]|uniref:bifunctional metallophosphatase/5'-nucleotidase n=1 Tax=Taibaiella sp. KBW10 TaxID=2153357 RepID=UPI000F5ABD41|nr:metallophosphatase [Taibaiella sp. KBW10]RQO32676.1 metallophosphatase [Taibaiella sp. KBW10]